MTPRILVPLDGSLEGEAILDEVARIAGSDADVHFLHVLPVPAPPTGMDPSALLVLNESAASYLAQARERHPYDRGTNIVRGGDPAEEICAAALELEAQAIAMCTHARTGLQRWFLGSVAEQVVRRSQLPVLLTRPGNASPKPLLRRILVPLDAFPESETVLNAVRLVAAKSRAEIILLHVVSPARNASTPWACLESKSTERRLQDIADGLAEEGFNAWSKVTSGDPAGEILWESRELGVDFIAMTTHARLPMERAVAGSVAQAVLKRTDRPVLLQRPLVVPQAVNAGERYAT